MEVDILGSNREMTKVLKRTAVTVGSWSRYTTVPKIRGSTICYSENLPWEMPLRSSRQFFSSSVRQWNRLFHLETDLEKQSNERKIM